MKRVPTRPVPNPPPRLGARPWRVEEGVGHEDSGTVESPTRSPEDDPPESLPETLRLVDPLVGTDPTVTPWDPEGQ